MRAGLKLGTILLLWGCEPVKSVPDDSGPGDGPRETGQGDTEPGETGETGSGPIETAEPAISEEEVPDYPTSYDHLPVLLIEADGPIGDGEKQSGWMELVRDHEGTLEDLEDAPRAWAGNVGIEIHGASSSGDPKHNFRLELRDETGEDVDYPLLGLGSDGDWVLHASYGDKTYLRNALAYRLGREAAAETGEWQPGTAFTEVFLNDAYQGVYLLTERIKRDADRLDLPAPATTASAGDITGGYIFKVDYNRGDYFTTDAGTLIEFTDPRLEELSSEQYVYIREWWDDFEAMLAGGDYDDPATGYAAWIDVDSWVDFILINELAHNIDAYRLSTYHYKEADSDGGLLHAGPIWDFDRAFGNVNYCNCWELDGWIYDDLNDCGAGYQFPFWWQRLLQDEGFQDLLRCRWEDLRVGALSDEAISAYIAEMTAEVAEAEPRDHDRWGTIGVNVGFNYYVGATWEEELTWFEEWVLARASWMDANVWGTCGGSG